MSFSTIILFIFCYFPFSDYPAQNAVLAYELPKRVQKSVNRIWKKQTIHYVQINEDLGPEMVLYEIYANERKVGFICLKEAKGCRIGGCEADVEDLNDQYWNSEGAYERFAYYLILDNEQVVLRTGVYDYPGDYGYEITSKWWQKQFQGYIGGDLLYGKNVDAISGATISAHSMCVDLENTYTILLDFIRE